uniref:Uncharacterized protein n=1 Tax=Cacopsylla melanoneura TaxID=428564 RepID=A0A8D8X7V1_9HEMI
MTLLPKFCLSLSLFTLVILTHSAASRVYHPSNPLNYNPYPTHPYNTPSLAPRVPRRANRQQATSYLSHQAQFYRPNYQPPSGHLSYEPSYEPSNYQESYNSAVGNRSPAYSSYKAPSNFETPNFDPTSFVDPAAFEQAFEPSSYQPVARAVRKSPAQKDHENAETRQLRQSGGGGGGGQDSYVDFGAHTGQHGSFGWYADFPAHKDT